MLRELLYALFRWATEPTDAQLREGFISQQCSHCHVHISGHRMRWCLACGKGYEVKSK